MTMLGSHRGPVPREDELRGSIAVDIREYSRKDRTEDIQRHLRRSLYDVLQRVLEGFGIDWGSCYREDRGDGALIILPFVSLARGELKHYDPLPIAAPTMSIFFCMMVLLVVDDRGHG